VASALLSFYVAYMAYRNLKAAVPLMRPGDLFDEQLASADRWLFAGHDPAVLLHSLLGTGFQTHLISIAYAAFIVFLPLSLAVALVFARRLRVSLFFATALSANWLIGAGSYFVLPSLGPIYVDPGAFASLPSSLVTHLQEVLLTQRVEFLRDPHNGTPQAIAAFASLHVSMSFTALCAAHLFSLARWLKVALWIWLALTIISTIYFGWHYVLDDVAGLVIAVAALALARVLTGFGFRTAAREASSPGSGGPWGRARP
jgi:membrane-associated phospholipid phosphatase